MTTELPTQSNPTVQKQPSFTAMMRHARAHDAIVPEGRTVRVGATLFPESPQAEVLAVLARNLPGLQADLVQRALLTGVFDRLHATFSGSEIVGVALRNASGATVPLSLAEIRGQADAVLQAAVKQAGIQRGCQVFRNTAGMKFALLGDGRYLNVEGLIQDQLQHGKRYHAYILETSFGAVVVPVPSMPVDVGRLDALHAWGHGPRMSRRYRAQIEEAYPLATTPAALPTPMPKGVAVEASTQAGCA